ncbi:hypothetical protein [Sphingobium sp. KCTC 72723]|uniref:hypothetical protein n=1 Tax=Sphingobium sp. KCTC 72723 TaxID=2733867 RepID=UPI00165E802C|nr:hypothetical protein [Sphingobium sp. KCTC 72723]
MDGKGLAELLGVLPLLLYLGYLALRHCAGYRQHTVSYREPGARHIHSQWVKLDDPKADYRQKVRYHMINGRRVRSVSWEKVEKVEGNPPLLISLVLVWHELRTLTCRKHSLYPFFDTAAKRYSMRQDENGGHLEWEFLDKFEIDWEFSSPKDANLTLLINGKVEATAACVDQAEDGEIPTWVLTTGESHAVASVPWVSMFEITGRGALFEYRNRLAEARQHSD